ncbi:hypothetical protein [Bradyrhizobium sp. USDA 4486]
MIGVAFERPNPAAMIDTVAFAGTMIVIEKRIIRSFSALAVRLLVALTWSE